MLSISRGIIFGAIGAVCFGAGVATMYAAMTLCYRSMFDGYEGGNLLSGAPMGIGGSILSAAKQAAMDPSLRKETDTDIGAAVRSISRSISSTRSDSLVEHD